MFNVIKWPHSRTGYDYLLVPQKGGKVSGWKLPVLALNTTPQKYIKYIKDSYDTLVSLVLTDAGVPKGLSIAFKYEEEAQHLVSLCVQGTTIAVEEPTKQFLISNIKNLNEKNYDKVEKTIMTTAFENETTKTVKSGSKISDAELDTILKIAYDNFADEPFKNADIAPLVPGLTIRQVPSRLKKMVDAGVLVDLGNSPKSYKVAR